MTVSLAKAVAEVESQLNIIPSTADTLATAVGTDYKEASIATYRKLLERIVSDNEIALGSGLWFEPYVYDSDEKYVGPYIYKDNGTLRYTEEYATAEYDYLSKSYYTVSQGLD